MPSVEPMSPYAVSKSAAEQYLRVYQSLYGLTYTSLRYANIYGPRQAGIVYAAFELNWSGTPTTGRRRPRAAS